MKPEIDTLRLVVTWSCNLACAYCCNRRPDVQERVRVVSLGEIEWAEYRTICLTGGEPLAADPGLLATLLLRAAQNGRRVVLYTNGMLLNRDLAHWLRSFGATHLNIGLHGWTSYLAQVQAVEAAVRRTGLHVRYHIQGSQVGNLRSLLESSGLGHVVLRTWEDGDCERANEDLVALEPVPAWLRGRQ